MTKEKVIRLKVLGRDQGRVKEKAMEREKVMGEDLGMTKEGHFQAPQKKQKCEYC